MVGAPSRCAVGAPQTMSLSFWPRFILLVLTTWRVTHLLAYEDGPGGILAGLRARMGSGFAGQLLDCFNCLSIWVAAPLALLMGQRPVDVSVGWLALSGAACLVEGVVREPVVIQPISSTME
jgi:hypothetical protein